MRNWSVNTTGFDKKSPEYMLWKYQQMINFGLDGEKLERRVLTKLMPSLEIDPAKRKSLEYMLKHVAAN